MAGFNTSEIVSAAHYKNPDEVAEVLRKGLNPDTAEKDLYRALCSACYVRSIKIVEMLLEAGAKPNIPGETLHSPLFIAAGGETIEIVELLLKANAEVNIEDKYGETPLYRAVWSQKYGVQIAKLLLEAGASVHCNAKEPILYRMNDENIDLVPLFINAGADINTRNRDGNTVLHKYASWNINDKMLVVIQRLVGWGADPFLVNKKGQTALDLVKEAEDDERKSPKTISFLREIMRKEKWWYKAFPFLFRRQKTQPEHD